MRNVNLIGSLRKRKITKKYVEGHKVRRKRPKNDPLRLKALGNGVVPVCAEVAAIWALMLMVERESA